MPFRYIPGRFRPDFGIPDGDSVRFKADDPDLLDQIEDRPVMFRSGMTVQLRYEGIDTLEKNAIEPFASSATMQNLSLLMGSGDSRGFILSRMLDNTSSHRPISFIFTGNLDATPGDQIFLDAALVRRSVNYQMVEGGFAYPFFFSTLFADLRDVMVEGVKTARADQRGIWAEDKTLAGFQFGGSDAVAALPPIFPRLFRRLEDFGDRQISGFRRFIDRMDTRLMTTPDGRMIEFSDIIEVEDNTIKMTRDSSELVFFN